MLERLADIERRYEELSDLINDPEIIADNERWRKLMKEHSDITPIVEKRIQKDKGRTCRSRRNA